MTPKASWAIGPFGLRIVCPIHGLVELQLTAEQHRQMALEHLLAAKEIDRERLRRNVHAGGRSV